MLSLILRKVAGIGLKAVAKYLIMAVAGVVLVWMWQDYQGLRDKNAAQAAQMEAQSARLKSVLSSHRHEMQMAHRARERMQQALDLQAEIASKRMKKNQALTREIGDLRNIERPNHEKKCPVHPAIVYAFDRLRGESKDGDRYPD